MVNSIRRFFKVYKDTTNKTAIAAGSLNFICYINKKVVGVQKPHSFSNRRKCFSRKIQSHLWAVFSISLLKLRLKKLGESCWLSPFLKAVIIFAISNRSGKTLVEKERFKRYTNGFATVCWLIFIIFVGVLFRPKVLFIFVYFMIEVTSFSFAGFKINELVTEFSS